MLKTRLLTAAVLSAIVIYTLSFASQDLFYPLFTVIVSFSIFLSGTEFAALRWNVMDGAPATVEQSTPKPKLKHFAIGFSYAFFVISFCVSASLFANRPQKILILPLACVFLCLFLSIVLIYRKATDMHTASNKILNITAGFIYLALPATCLTQLSLMNFEGSYRGGQIYFCLATILMGDTGAYFVGTRFGKHKLLPKVSPKKSIEGAVGGLALSGLTACLAGIFFKLPFPAWSLLILGICMGLAGQIGDLMESAFKRAGGYKDSGKMLPGHGGFLDRIDSLIVGIPVAFIFFSFFS